jgi:hypothetical protein
VPVVEAAVKVGDSSDLSDPKRSWYDGMPIEIKAPGHYITGPEIVAYYQSGTPPAEWPNLHDHEREVTKRRFDQIKWLTEPGRTAEDLHEVRPRTSLEVAQRVIAQAEAEKFNLINYGCDTNWGWNDLRHHAIVRVDIPMRWVQMISEVPIVTDEHPYAERKTKKRRRYRVKYEDYFTPAELADISDSSIWVAADRTKAAADSSIVEVLV